MRMNTTWSNKLSSAFNSVLKRTCDILFSVSGLIMVTPVIIAVAVMVKLDSNGPVLYKAERVGRNGKIFYMYKFRSMVVDADKTGSLISPENDPRITKAGRFLRRYELDELPQLVNVLVGQMSFVGPRPEVEQYTRQYTEEEKVILTVIPGMTDYSTIEFINLSKILARSLDQNKEVLQNIMPRKNRLRVEYALNNSVWIDLNILIQTFKSIVRVKWSTKS